MRRKAPLIVFDDEGPVGFLDPGTVVAGADRVRIHLEEGRDVEAPGAAMAVESDGRVRLLVARDALAAVGIAEGADTQVVPVVAEEVAIGKRKVQSGKVRIKKGVTTREETVEVPTVREEVSIERVPINRPVDGPVEVRHEGDVMIVPVVEEVVVIEKRLILKEELRITRRRVEETKVERVTLRTETATVERDGN